MVVKTKLKKHSKSSTLNPVLQEKENIAHQLFQGRCYVCRKKYGKGFGFHHTEYLKGELQSKDFGSIIWYHAYLLPILLEDPKRFFLLCKNCHFQMYLADLNKKQFARLFEVLSITKPRKRKNRKNKKSKNKVRET